MYLYIYIYIYIYIYVYIYIFIYSSVKNIIKVNNLTINDPFLLNKKDSQGVIFNI